jgi:hypothetical protein
MNPRIDQLNKELEEMKETAATATPAYRDFMREAFKLKLIEKRKLEREI